MNTYKFFSLFALVLLTSCATYTIPVQSFKEQMMQVTPGTVQQVEINNPLSDSNIKYTSNTIDRIIVVDKDGKKTYLDNSPSIEMRVTHQNGKKYHFYFDTVILENDSIKGGRSRFQQGLTRAIPLDSVVNIEVQEGGKKFSYQSGN